MKRRKPLKRRTRLRRVNAQRRASRYILAYGGRERVRWMKGLPCIVTGCTRRPSDCAHIEAGGLGMKATADKTVPVCRLHHQELDAGKRRFEVKYNVDLQQLAAEYARQWESRA